MSDTSFSARDAEYLDKEYFSENGIIKAKSNIASDESADKNLKNGRSVRSQNDTVSVIDKNNCEQSARCDDDVFYECNNGPIDSNTPKASVQIKTTYMLQNNDENDEFHDCVSTQSASSIHNAQVSDEFDVLEAEDPIEGIIMAIRSEHEEPESYLINNPDFFVSCFASNPASVLDGMYTRISALIDDSHTWLFQSNAGKKLEDLDKMLEDLNDENICDNDIEQFKIFADKLRGFEKEFNITPYEDICKATVLMDSNVEMKVLLDDESLSDDFMGAGLANSENPDIHKSSGAVLTAYIDKKIEAHFSLLKQKATNILVEALNGSAFAVNHGEVTVEQLYLHAIQQKDGLASIKQWLEANISGKLGSKSSLGQKDIERSLKELHLYGASEKDLSLWLQNDQNTETKECLNETLAIIYSQLSMNDIKKNIEAASDGKMSLTGSMVLCQRCHTLLSKYQSSSSKAVLDELSSMSTELKDLSIKEITSTGSIGSEIVYYLPSELSLEKCETQPHLKKEADIIKKKLLDLVAMKNKPLNSISFSDEASLKNELLKAQIDLLFKHLETQVGGEDTKHFDDICQIIESVNGKRFSVQILKEDGKSAFDKVMGIGLSALHGKEIPVETRLCNIKLQNDIHLDGYSYEDEKHWLANHLVHAIGALGDEGVDAYKRLCRDKHNPLKLLWNVFNIKDGVCNKVQDVLNKEFFDDFKVLMKNNPRLARNLVGDVAQSAAIVKQVFGEHSLFSNLFEQLDWRTYGETAQSYLNTHFEDKASEYGKLSDKEKASVQHMYALCDMLKDMPTTIHAAKIAINVTKDIGCGNVGKAIAGVVSGAAELWGAQKIQQNVGRMSDDEVRALNLALKTLQCEPLDAMIGLDEMSRSTDRIADVIKGRSVLNNCFRNSELMYPFVHRFNRLSSSFHDYWGGKSDGRALALELGKVGVIAGAGIGAFGLTAVAGGGVAAGLGLSSVSWTALGLVTSYSVPTLLMSLSRGKPEGTLFLSVAHSVAKKLIALESLEAPANVISDLVSTMTADPSSELKQLEGILTTKMEDAFQRDNPQIKAYHTVATSRQTCLDAYNKHWKAFIFDSDRAECVVATIDKLHANNNEAFEQQVIQLQKKLDNWHKLQSFINKLPADSSNWLSNLDNLQLDESMKKRIGKDALQLPYAVISELEILQEEIAGELGVELNWQKGIMRNAETGAEMTFEGNAMKEHLKLYQSTILLGEYLIGHFSPASMKLSAARLDAERTVLKRTKKRYTEQATGLAQYLLRLGISNLVSAQKNDSGCVNKEAFKRSLDGNESLKVALARQISLMERAAKRCVKEQVSQVHDSLVRVGVNIDKAKLKKLSRQG